MNATVEIENAREGASFANNRRWAQTTLIISLSCGLAALGHAVEWEWVGEREIQLSFPVPPPAEPIGVRIEGPSADGDLTIAWDAFPMDGRTILESRSGLSASASWEEIRRSRNPFTIRERDIERATAGETQAYRVRAIPRERAVFFYLPANHPMVLEREGVDLPGELESKEFAVVFGLHGFTEDRLVQENERMPFQHLQDRPNKEFIYVLLDGTLIDEPNWFRGKGWNAYPSCCVPQDSEMGAWLNDIGFLSDLGEYLRDEAQFQTDADRIFLTGFSNGAMMSMRLLQERGDLFAAGAVYAGTIWNHRDWEAEHPISLLAAHATNDQTVLYSGGSLLGPYPGAVETITMWAEKLGIEGTLEPTGETLDIDARISGEETEVFRFSGEGVDGGERRPVVEHWRVNGGPHDPRPIVSPGEFTELPERMIDFLFDHPKL